MDKLINEKSESTKGTVLGVLTYVMWGCFPVYWKLLSSVPAFQVLSHRIVWSFLLTLFLVIVLRHGKALQDLFSSPKKLLFVILAGIFITLNWGVYIWAVQQNKIVESSLGYFLNPLVSVIFGVIFLKEKLDKGIIIACLVALVGIIVQIVAYGQFPWISIALALTFAIYGLIKKVNKLDALTGLVTETAVVTPCAIYYILFCQQTGSGAFVNAGWSISLLLFLAGAVTAIPLFTYAESVKRIPLTRIGFLQYISPVLQLSFGLFIYGEKMDTVKLISFALIISALLIYVLTRFKKH